MSDYQPTWSKLQTAMPEQNSNRTEIVFILDNVDDWQTLADGIRPGIQIKVIDSAQDGLAQMAQILEGRSGIDAIHVVSHGSTASVQLGTLNLTAKNLEDHSNELAAIGRALNADADILLYGCDVAAGSSGAAFVAALAQTTQADVAASSDMTGTSLYGGNWILEEQTGIIDSTLPFTPEVLTNYNHLLADTTINFDGLSGSWNNNYSYAGFTWQGFNYDPGFGVASTDEIIIENSIAVSNITKNTGYFTPVSIAAFYWTAEPTITFNGYRDGSLVATVDYTLPFGASTSPNPGIVYNFPGSFANINRLEIDPTTISSSIGGFDNFIYTPVVVTSPTITSATYNASTNVLAVTGANMTTGDTIDVTKLTLTGQGGSTYTLTSANVTASSSTAFSVTLNAADQINVEGLLNNAGTASVGGTTYNLAGALNWDSTASAAADTTGNGVTVSNVQPPTITSATYDAATGVVTVTGTNLVKTIGATNDITANKLNFTGEGGTTYTLTTTSVEITSGTSFTVTLNATDKAAINQILNKNGTASTGGTIFNLASADDWDSVITGGDISDTTGNGITVSNVAVPTITSSTYDASTGLLVVTGTGFLKLSGATNDIDISKLTFTGEGGSTYTLTTTSVEITSGTSFTVTLNASDKAAINQIVNKNGTVSTGGTTFNLAAAEDWAAGAAAGVTDVDATNAITVSNVAVPTITSSTYDAATGALVVTGTGFLKLNSASNDIVANKFTFTGEGGATYTLTDTANVEITSGTSFTIILSSTDKAAINLIINKNGTVSTGGTTFNLVAAEDWAAGAAAGVTDVDATNAITVSNVAVPAITSSTYDAATGALVVTGTGFLKLNGATNDIDVSKLTFTGEGGSTYSLTTTSVEITSGTSFTVTLNATDKAAINQIFNKNGTSSTGATTYNLSASEDWAAGADVAVVVADITGNGITVSNVAVPTITSSTYNAATGALVVTGTGFLKLNGATNDIDVSKLTFTGEGGSTYSLTTTSVEITSGTSFTVTLNATDMAAINQIVNKNGTVSTGGTTFNLAAAEDWAAGADAAVVVADTTGNGITASNVAVPNITSSTYDAASGVLVVTGTGFSLRSGATNDIVANKFTFTGEGGAGAAYTLTDTANVEITSGTSFTITLSATDKAAIDLIINKNGTASTGGTTFNLSAAEDWAAGADLAVVVADLAGNGITASNVGPTVSIVVSDTALSVGETSLVTFTFSEAVTGFTNADLTIANGTLSAVSSSDGGVTWTATFSPTTNITDSTNLIAINMTGLTSVSTSTAGIGSTDSNNYAIDTLRPTANIVVADTALAAGETSLVTITFNEAVTGFTNADLTIANGTLSAVSSSDGGVTWTATFTPTVDTTDATNLITLANTGVLDAAGNTGTATTDSNNYAIDTLRPTASIVVADTALLAGETSAVTITFNEAVSGLTNADLTIANGTLSPVSSSDGGVTWTATFTPTADTTDASNLITLANTGVQDAAGNAGTGTTDSNNYAIDTLRPTASIVVADTALAAGETSAVTITFNKAITGFTNADLTIANGTLSAVSSSDGGITWTATFTPTADTTDATNLITLTNTGVQDAAGNAGTGTTDSNNYAIDTLRPTASIVVADTALLAGETSAVTITFNEAVSGLTNADLTIANGTLSPVSSSDGGVTWTATFTPTADTTDASNLITLANTGVLDAAGNAGTGTTDSNSYAIDTLRPTASIVVTDTALLAGETSLVTVTFNEAVSGFSNADLTIANGTLSPVSSSDGGITWTATLTPTGNISDTSNIITLNNTGVTDAAGNTGTGTTDSNNYAIDTLRPTASIVVSDIALAVGETSLVTITFNEAVSDFTNADLTVANGTLTAVSSADGGITWTATFIPTVDTTDTTNIITLANTGVTDAAGNAGTGTTDSNNYAIDTLRPTATIVVADTSLAAGETSTVTITFSEAVSGLTTGDLTVANGSVDTPSSSDGGTTWTATFTPTAAINDTTNIITLDNTGVTDAAGNTGTGTTDSNNYAIDTERPTVGIVVADNALLAGETSEVTFTFSEAVTGFTNDDLTIDNGSLSAVNSADGGTVWTGTFTPTAGITDAANLISIDNTGVTDSAGNAGSGSTDSNNYAIATARPTAGIVVADNTLRSGETSLVTITFSEAVTGFSNADLTVANGTLGAVSSSDGGTVWTATFTPTAGISDATNLITLDNTGVTNASGNTGSGTTDSNNYAIDMVRPTVGIVVSDDALALGGTSQVTFTFSEAVTNFTNVDLTVANGSLSAVSSADGGTTWTATFTPTAGITSAANVITLDNTAFTDIAGNAGLGSTSSNNYLIDTERPTVGIVVDDRMLRSGETSLVTLIFSEAVMNFTNDDLTIDNGSLSAVSSSDGGVTWTATLTPAVPVIDDTNLITLDNTGISDSSGNAGSGTTESNNYAIETLAPTVDDDNDGISAGSEDQVPGLPPIGGGTTVAGDGNGDGTTDSQQPAVASAPFLHTPTAVSNPGSAPPVFVTLVVDSNNGVIDITDNNNAQLTSMQQLDAPDELPADLIMPLGLISFTTNVEQAGITETFSLFVDSNLGINGYWKQDNAGTWVNIATSIETFGDITRIDFAITDGGPFDHDGLPNGVIVDPGAVGYMPLSIVGATPDTTDPGFWF